MSQGFADFDPYATAALAAAQQEAGVNLVGHVGTEHLLAGLAQIGDSAAGRALGRLGITVAAVHEGVREQATRTQRIILSEVPTSSMVEVVLERARAGAAARRAPQVGSEDLLLALAEAQESVAGKVLAELGAGPDAVRRELSAG
ncbi:MAG TPA: Clp protease N-terminal domain-containing protein [Candidatus Dormibacteraeota bacterium]|jgi:ATP-dependent Clp protease ATP-binding subunit ClpC|nr:Clp protease N-terminal domain-containing protein [Candidatus Dormibacteraeota bacterium]